MTKLDPLRFETEPAINREYGHRAESILAGWSCRTILLVSLVVVVSPPVLPAPDSLPEAPNRGSSPWGKDDQRGAANRMSSATTLSAIKLIQRGDIYSLGREYSEGMPMVSGRSYVLTIPAPAAPVGKNKISGHEEFVASQLGQVGTQFDGLGHVGVGDVFFNGLRQEEFVTPKGLTKLGIENVGVFLTRGVLLDIAALKNRARLDKGYEISEADLKQALQRQNIQIQIGDVVLIHTGWGSLWNVDNALHSSGQPGIGMQAARFLAQQKIVLVGSDNWGIDVIPGPIPDVIHPAHQILLTENGIYTLENLDTSALARDKVYEFAFFFAPLRLKGATGSPGNPVAIR